MEEYTFDAELYAWEARPESWVFVTLPTDVSDTIDGALTSPPRGFGSVRVHVRCGSTSWDTSIFPSKEEGSYVLPVKKAVRRAEDVEPGDTATFTLTLAE
jgi:Domain of unknown function (DUF1905)